MGSYNTKCQEEECKTKIRKFEKDAFHCKYHRCRTFNCNLNREEGSRYCKHHI